MLAMHACRYSKTTSENKIGMRWCVIDDETTFVQKYSGTERKRRERKQVKNVTFVSSHWLAKSF